MVANAPGGDSTCMPTSHASAPTTGAPLKVFLADDSALIRDRVAAMLCAQGMSIAGEAATSWLSPEGENYDVKVRLPIDQRSSRIALEQLPFASRMSDPQTGRPFAFWVQRPSHGLS